MSDELPTFDYDPETRVVFGLGSIARLGDLAGELGANRALVVTDPGIAAAGIVDAAIAALEKAHISCVVFDGVEKNPTTRHVDAGVACARQQSAGVDLIIGLGGGSAMDCAKGVNFLLTNGGRMQEYWGDGKATRPLLPAIGIPTTAGTGSEAQRFALIADDRTHQKMACGDRKARFRITVLDPDLTRSAPAAVAAAAGIDAVSHAVESYVATNGNPLSRMFAREAMRLLTPNLRTSLTSGSQPARSDMLLGAHWAGAAIENSMLGAAHACANPLTAHYGIAHGIAVGVMLPHVVRFNNACVNGEYDDLASAAGLAGEDLADRLQQLAVDASLPPRLRDLGVEEAGVPELAMEAAEQKTAAFNPRPVGAVELARLYAEAY